MKIYIVTAGEYSDYHIERVFLDKKKAEYWARLENGIDEYTDCGIEEFDTSDENVDCAAKIVPVYHYDEWRSEWGRECMAVPGVVFRNERFQLFSEKELPEEVVEKIFRDRRTQMEAEKNGLT